MNPVERATVLIVDDDDGWRAVVKRWLEDHGMHALGVPRGERTTAAIRTHAPAVVLLDVHLPGLDGLHVLEVIRRRWPSVPVIVMTAFGGHETADLARRCGASGYLDKPCRMADLVREVERVAALPLESVWPDEAAQGPRGAGWTDHE